MNEQPLTPGSSEDLGLSGQAPLNFKPSGSSAELRALEQTIALMNDPRVTGAVVPPEEKQLAKVFLRPQDAPQPATSSRVLDPTTLPPAAPTPEPPATPASFERIMLTGRTGAGKDFIAAQAGRTVLHLDSIARDMVRATWGVIVPGEEDVVQTLIAWGAGVVNKQYPLSVSRWVTLRLMQEEFGWTGFGQSPDYWAQLLIAEMEQDDRVIVTDVSTLADFKTLEAAGFRHYHVTCAPSSYAIRPKRMNANDGLASILDQNLVKELSQNRQGRKLRCVWSETLPAPSPRVMAVTEWLKEISTEAAVAGD